MDNKNAKEVSLGRLHSSYFIVKR